jgi:starvation-inducible DNA-binding protein
VKQRSWDDYSLERDLVDAHLAALDLVYVGVISSHRDAIGATEEIDPVTQDLLIEQTAVLEQFHWFVRAHLEDAGGHLADRGDRTEKAAAGSARRATDAPRPRKRATTKSG